MRRLFFWPNLTRFNPYQSILYFGLNDHVVSDQLPWHTESELTLGDSTLHLHWEHWIYRGLRTEDEVELAIYVFLSKLVQFICRGGTFLWTIHNVEPHENIWPKQHAILQESLASLSHAILVHNLEGKNHYSERFPGVFHKIFIVRHPSYREYLSKIDPSPINGLRRSDVKTFLFFGQIRKYKGLDFVLSSLSHPNLQAKPWRLIIAGDGPVEEYVARFYTGEIHRLIVVNRRISDGEVKYLAGISDIAVFAFKKILSSGSMQMMADLGLPIIAPAFYSLQESFELFQVCWYHLSDTSSFVEAIERAVAKNCEVSARLPLVVETGIPRLGGSGTMNLPEVLARVELSGETAKRRSSYEGKFGCVIFCWPGREDDAKETQSQISKAGLPCHVVYSELSSLLPSHSVPSDWIKVPDDWYFGRKLMFVLEFFNYDVLLQVQADASYSDWSTLVARLFSAFNDPKPYEVGVWAPDLDYTFWRSPEVDIGRDPKAGLKFVMQTDTTCWALSAEIQRFLRTTPLVLNNIGWGVDWAAISYAYTSGKVVCRDECIKIFHPQGSNYARDEARLLEVSFIRSLPVELQVQIRILSELTRSRITKRKALPKGGKA